MLISSICTRTKRNFITFSTVTVFSLWIPESTWKLLSFNKCNIKFEGYQILFPIQIWIHWNIHWPSMNFQTNKKNIENWIFIFSNSIERKSNCAWCNLYRHKNFISRKMECDMERWCLYHVNRKNIFSSSFHCLKSFLHSLPGCMLSPHKSMRRQLIVRYVSFNFCKQHVTNHWYFRTFQTPVCWFELYFI